MKTQTELAHVYEVYIRTTPQKLWQALTDGKTSKEYFYGGTLTSDWKVGSSMDLVDVEAGRTMLVNRILEIDPPRVLSYSWFANWHENPSQQTIVRWELIPTKSGTRLKVVHSGLLPIPGACQGYSQGWPGLVQSLKDFVEK